MHPIAWMVVGAYSAVSLFLGLFLARRASQGVESYFAGNRAIPWWLAGTSMAATAFSSDTPLLVTGITRSRGLWGNWEIWSLAVSTMLAVFVFSKLWKRSGVLTEVEFVELRYGGKSASFLRGFKALYWGIFYNAFIIGAWPITGLVKVMQETTGWGKAESIFFSLGLTVVYTSLAGYLGVVLTDLFQFVWAMAGAVILACYALHAAGGAPGLVEKLGDTGKLSFLPPAESASWFAGLFLIQWWAWKNADGGGLAVQRMVSTKDERESMRSMLWFNVAHYVLRSWPWVLTGLASLVLIPDSLLTITEGGRTFIDHERAYPRLITMLLPAGLRGVLVASFFAAFMSTVDSQLNWGASYFVNDFYRRFVKKKASESHYVLVSRMVPLFLAGLAAAVAFHIRSIGQIFTLVLNLTAGVGPVYLLRWFWPRVNAWSEIAAMSAALPLILLRARALEALGVPADPLFQLIYMVAGTALIWLPATWFLGPGPSEGVARFFRRVTPADTFRKSAQSWLVATAALLATLIGPVEIFFGRWQTGIGSLALALGGWVYALRKDRISGPS